MNIIIASILAGLSVAIPTLWFLSIPAIALFFYELWFQTNKLKYAFTKGLLFGFATVGAATWWIWDSLPLSWLNIESTTTQVIVIFLTWFVLSILISISPAVYAMFVFKVRKSIFIPAISVFAWVAQEMVREWLFYFITLGKQSLPGAHFSISALGYTLAENTYLLQLADKFGIYGLSFTISLIGSVSALSIYSVLHKEKYISTLVGIFILLALLSIPLWNKNSYDSDKTMNFSLLAADVLIDAKVNPSIIYKKMLEEIALYENIPDIIVFPEGGGLATSFPDKIEREVWLNNLFGDNEVLVISSNYTDDKYGKTYSILYYDSSTEGNLAVYKKMFLMPQGEFAAYISSPLFKMLGNKTVNNHIDSLGISLERGSETVAVPYKDLTIGSLLCTEMLSPQLYRNLVKEQNANILINLSHTSWFNGSNVLFTKMQQMAKVHSVQNRKYFIQTSNGFPSYVLNPYGEVLVETNRGETKIVNIDIPILKE